MIDVYTDLLIKEKEDAEKKKIQEEKRIEEERAE